MQEIYIHSIGMVAGICTTISFIPQIVKIIRTNHTRDISLLMYCVFAAGVSLWLVYGLFLKSYPMIIANGITLFFCFFILTRKITALLKEK